MPTAAAQWRGVQRVTSSILGTYSTQSLLAAVGVAGTRGVVGSSVAAAGMNWVMKDGLGR